MRRIAVFVNAQQGEDTKNFKGIFHISEIGSRKYILLEYFSKSNYVFENIDNIDFDISFKGINERFEVKGKFIPETFVRLTRRQELWAKIAMCYIPCSIRLAILQSMKEKVTAAVKADPFDFVFVHPPKPSQTFAEYKAEVELDEKICNEIFE